MSDHFALALLSLDGVGRVTVHRILERFPTLEALRATPREQVLLRLKGVPHAERTVETLFSEEAFGPAMAQARAEINALAQRRVRVIAPGSPDWPGSLDALDRSDRPAVLYAYGHVSALERPALAILARAPIAGDDFEAIQGIARRVLGRGHGLVVGAADGVDVALQKLAVGAGGRAVAVIGTGLTRLTPSLRPAATALVRGGGLLLSPFPMTHGPFEHDDRERALVQAALGAAVCAVAPAADSSEDRAMAWAAGADRPIAVLPPAPPGASWANAALTVADAPAADAVADLVG